MPHEAPAPLMAPAALAEEIARRLEALKRRPAELLRYDLDGNGVIDDSEWAHIEAVIRGEILTERARAVKATAPTPEALPSGEVEVVGDRFELTGVLGRGSQAVTYQGRDRETGHTVAVKVLDMADVKDWKQVELFDRECRTLEHLAHPAIPRYVAAFHAEAEGGRVTFYLVQEHVEGRTIQSLIEGGKTWDDDEVHRFVEETLDVLEYLHTRSPPVIHRDIKPSNIIMRPDGRVALIDFGGIQTVLPTKEGGSTIIGTSGYMPPEQFIGKAVPATDLYALGATLVHMLSGKHPADLPVERMRLRYEDVVRAAPDVLALVGALLAPLVEDRPASANAAAAFLGAETAPASSVASSLPTIAGDQWSVVVPDEAPNLLVSKEERGSDGRTWQVSSRVDIYLSVEDDELVIAFPQNKLKGGGVFLLIVTLVIGAVIVGVSGSLVALWISLGLAALFGLMVVSDYRNHKWTFFMVRRGSYKLAAAVPGAPAEVLAEGPTSELPMEKFPGPKGWKQLPEPIKNTFDRLNTALMDDDRAVVADLVGRFLRGEPPIPPAPSSPPGETSSA